MQPVDLVGLQMTRPFKLVHALLRGNSIAQQRVQVGLHEQPGSFRNFADQPTGVILPPVLRDAAGIPCVEQRPQHRRQVGCLWHLRAFD
jgi:hypothetical protein